MNTDLQNLSDLIAGKTAIQVDVPTSTIIYFSIGIFVAVLLAVILANQISK